MDALLLRGLSFATVALALKRSSAAILLSPSVRTASTIPGR